MFAVDGIGYADLIAMDLAEYQEAIEARLIWQEEWKPKINGM